MKISLNYIYFILFFVIVSIDQLIKVEMIKANIFIKNDGIFLFDKLSLSYYNSLFFQILFDIILVFIFFMILKSFQVSNRNFIFTLIFSGLSSNLIDKIYRGFVVDYVIIKNIIFNIADIAIWIALFLFIFDMLKKNFFLRRDNV